MLCAAIVVTKQYEKKEQKDVNANFIGVALYNARNATEKLKLALATNNKNSTTRGLATTTKKLRSLKKQEMMGNIT